MKRRIVLGLSAATMVLVGCHEPTSGVKPVSGLVSGTGSMLVTGDCYAWHIKADSGPYYEVLGLAEEFKQRDLRVRFKLRERSDVVSACMMGHTAEVVSMSKL